MGETLQRTQIISDLDYMVVEMNVITMIKTLQTSITFA